MPLLNDNNIIVTSLCIFTQHLKQNTQPYNIISKPLIFQLAINKRPA